MLKLYLFQSRLPILTQLAEDEMTVYPVVDETVSVMVYFLLLAAPITISTPTTTPSRVTEPLTSTG